MVRKHVRLGRDHEAAPAVNPGSTALGDETALSVSCHSVYVFSLSFGVSSTSGVSGVVSSRPLNCWGKRHFQLGTCVRPGVAEPDCEPVTCERVHLHPHPLLEDSLQRRGERGAGP